MSRFFINFQFNFHLLVALNRSHQFVFFFSSSLLIKNVFFFFLPYMCTVVVLAVVFCWAMPILSRSGAATHTADSPAALLWRGVGGGFPTAHRRHASFAGHADIFDTAPPAVVYHLLARWGSVLVGASCCGAMVVWLLVWLHLPFFLPPLDQRLTLGVVFAAASPIWAPSSLGFHTQHYLHRFHLG